MLPQTIDHVSKYQFKTSDRDGHLFIMLVNQYHTAPVEPLWIRACGNEESRVALQLWLSVRRDDWQDLGVLAEEIGFDAFSRHVDGLMADNSPGIYQGTIVNRPDDERQVAFGMYLSTGRVEPLYVHTFASAGKRDRFFEWFHAGNHQLTDELVDIAFEKGTLALASELNSIADQQRAPRPKRKAASRGPTSQTSVSESPVTTTDDSRDADRLEPNGGARRAVRLEARRRTCSENGK